MGLGDVTGILSRYFVLGFYVPAFFTLVALAQLATDGLLPNAYERLGNQDRILVLGALALLVGLALAGLRYPITRALEGYPFERGPGRFARAPLIRLQRRSYDRLKQKRDDAKRTSGERTACARLLDRRFHRDPDKLLTTRFGNAYRAGENYSFTRWGLDGIAIWPRVDAMLTEREQELHTTAASDLAFFVNGTVGALITGVVLVADGLADEFVHPWWVYLLPFALAYSVYRASIGAVERLGTERRASVDLHRLELYEKLGVRAPATFGEERTEIAPAVNKALLWGQVIPDAYTRKPEPQKGEAT